MSFGYEDMYATFGGAGVYISLGLKDKEKGLKDKILSCRLDCWKKPELFLHIKEKVTEKGFLEEEGFHIEVIPSDVGPEFRTQYDIYLSESIFEELTNPAGPIIKRGHSGSRSIYGRIDIVYFGL